MEVKLIDNFDDFLKLRQPWNELSRQTPDDHAFMRHEWFEHWLSSQEMTSRLHVITGWQDGQLVGVLPLVWKSIRLRGMHLRSLGLAESSVSPRCNALIVEGERLGPLVERLVTERKSQLIELQHLEAASPTTRSLVASLRHQSRLLVHVSPGRQSPYLTVDRSWDEYMKGLSGHRRAWIRGTIKKLQANGRPFEFRYISDESGAEFLTGAIMQVSNRSWKADVGTAISQVPSQQRLYAEFTRIGLAHGLVEAIVLTIDGRPVAFDYYLTCGRRHSLIRGDFDKEYAGCRPGENIRAAYITRLGQSAVPAEVDFGGAVAEYKSLWANAIRDHIVIHAATPYRRGALVLLWKKLTGGEQRHLIRDGSAAAGRLPDSYL